MTIRNIILSCSCLSVLWHYSLAAYADFPASCFQSKDDYDLYLKYGDQAPPPPPMIDEAHYNSLSISEKMEYQRLYSLHMRGPVKPDAKVVINVKQSQASSGAPVIADASGSKTPSGTKGYAWGSANVVSTSAEYSSPGGAPGTYHNIQLKVTDPVCGAKAVTQVKVTSH